MSWHLHFRGRSRPRSRHSRGFAMMALRAVAMMALLAVATLTTGFEVHSHREVLSSGLAHDAMQGEAVSPAAIHPGAAPHWEAGGVETTFRCPVCLLHLQTSGAAAQDAAGPIAQVPDRSLAATHPGFADCTSRLPGGSRAPPYSR